MKITLFALNGSYNHTNLALRRIRPLLENEGFEVNLIETGLRDSDSSLLESLYAEKADVYGFSSYIWNITRMLSLAKDLKSILPECRTVFGGPEVSYDCERFEKLDFIDFIVSGAGEHALLDICKSLSLGKEPERFVNGGKTELSEGILYREDEQYRSTRYYESSVGCPFSCAFCLSSATRGVSAKSAELALSELYEFEKLDGDFIVKLVDRTFNFDIERANTIWRGLLDSKYTKRYQFEICANLLNDESISILSRFPKGKVQLEVGLQSTNTETLASVSRHLDPDKTLDICKKIKESGNVHLHLDLIAGLPFENIESFKESFNAAYPVCDQLQLGFLKLLHGTALRRDAEKYGYAFSAEPPYTVLKNNWISYSELRRLDSIADLLERYSNSGHFSDCLEYALPFANTPFDFFDGLLDYISSADGRNIRKIGQNDAYALLFAYASSLPDINEDILSEKLHKDYTSSEVRRPPKVIR